jgi:hypothetical protein
MRQVFLAVMSLLFLSVDGQSNLTAQFISYPQPNIKKGDYLTFSFKVKNIGISASTSCHTSIYLSSTTSFSNAILIGDISTEALNQNAETQTVTYTHPVPITMGNGNYYVMLYPDSKQEVQNNINNLVYLYTNTININSVGGKQNLPYPVILIHGLNGNDTTWYSFIRDVQSIYGYSYGGTMDFCLNQDGDLSSLNLSSLPMLAFNLSRTPLLCVPANSRSERVKYNYK